MNFVNRVSPILFAIALLANQSSAFAAVIGAEEATKLLAKSQSIEEKCKFLTASQHDELTAFVAKAEIAMVAKSSTSTAKSIIAAGRASGKNALCTDAERADIVDIISAAHQATSASAQANPAPSTTAERIAPQKTMVAATPNAKPIGKTPKLITERVPQTGGLNSYAALTQRYYIARRCKSMTYGSITGLYKEVVFSHRNMVANFGVPAVRAVLSKSESKANAANCS